MVFHPAALDVLGDTLASASEADQWLIRSDLRLLNEFGEAFFALVEVGDEAGLVECWMQREQSYGFVMERLDEDRLCVLSVWRAATGESERHLALERARIRRYR